MSTSAFGVEHGDISKAQTANIVRAITNKPGLLRKPGIEGDYVRAGLKNAGNSVDGKRSGYGYGAFPSGAGRPNPNKFDGAPVNWSRKPKSVRQKNGQL